MNDKLKLMKDGDINKALVTLSLPVIVGLLITSIYNFTDSLFVSALGTEALGATSIVYPLITLIPGVALLFGNGGATFISQLLGAGKKEKAEIVLASTLFYCTLASLVIQTIMLIFLDPLLRLIGASDAILPIAREYSYILIASFIFHLLSVVLMNLVRAEGAVGLSTCSQVVGAVSNIILDPIFIFKLNLGVRGAAIATVIAQIISFLILIPYYISGKSYLRFSIKNIRISYNILKPIVDIGFSLFAINLFQCISISLLNVLAAPYGDFAVAGIGIVTRICSIPFFVVSGFSRGFQTLVAFNYGARDFERVEKSTKTAFIWAVSFCVFISVIQVIFSEPLVGLFSKKQDVIDIGIKCLIANSIVFFTYGFQQVVIVLLLSIQKEKEGLFLSLGRQGIFFIPLAFIFSKLFGLKGILYTQAGADVLTTIVALTVFTKTKRKLTSSAAFYDKTYYEDIK